MEMADFSETHIKMCGAAAACISTLMLSELVCLGGAILRVVLTHSNIGIVVRFYSNVPTIRDWFLRIGMILHD
jgi:hypothetical protein